MNEPATDLPVALLQGTGAALVAITLSAPLASTAGVAAIAGPLRRVLPGAASVLHAFAAGCQRLRARDKLFVASHAMTTYACGDLLVQLASHTGGVLHSSAVSLHAGSPHHRQCCATQVGRSPMHRCAPYVIRPLGSSPTCAPPPVALSIAISPRRVCDQALPFYYWSSLLAGVGSTTARALS